MKLSTFLLVALVIYGVFGLGLIVAPALSMSVYGLDLDDSGVLMSRGLGAALIGLAFMFWPMRSAAFSTVGVQAILRGNLIYHAIACVISSLGTLAGVLGALGWLLAFLHLALALAFAYFAFAKKPQVAISGA